MRDDTVALFEFEFIADELSIRDEKHSRLVSPDGLTDEELAQYRQTSQA